MRNTIIINKGLLYPGERVDLKPSCTKWMDITPLRSHSSLMNCFNKSIFPCFYYELTFHILSRDRGMLGLSKSQFGQKVDIAHNHRYIRHIQKIDIVRFTWLYPETYRPSCSCRQQAPRRRLRVHLIRRMTSMPALSGSRRRSHYVCRQSRPPP